MKLQKKQRFSRSLTPAVARWCLTACAVGILLVVGRFPSGRFEARAARAPMPAQTIAVRDSGAPIGNGDFVGCSTSPGLNTYYAIFIEVPSGTARLTIDLFDADYGSTTGSSGNLYDNPVTPATSTQFSLFDPAGSSIPLNTLLTGTGLNFNQGNQSAVGTNGPDTRAANGDWKNFFTRADPDAGHWELRIVQPGGGSSGVNHFGIAAHTLDPGSNRDQNLGGPTSGRGLNMYFDPGIHIGPQTPGRTPPITWNYYPYITSGCNCRANEFDWDAPSGTGSINFTSRTGSYTFSTTTVSGNASWVSNNVNNWTTNVSAVDYGIWQNTLTISAAGNNHITYYIGSYAAVVPNSNGTNILASEWRQGDKFRVYFPGDAGASTAPLKPYMTQRLFHINGPNPPCVGNTTFYRVRVDIVNPTDEPIVLDGTTIGSRTRRVQANIPNVPGVSYANESIYGGAQVTQGTFTQPADGATSGSIFWTPGTISANSGASLFYVIRVAPTLSSPCVMDVTGAPGGAVEGTTAVWLDETGNTTQERATYTFGPLCALRVDRSGACTGCLGSAPPTPTKVDVTDLTALRYATGVTLVQWATGYEADHLGFHVWRETGGKRERITPELIAGSALLTRDALTAGQHYVWRDDTLRLTRAPVNYWLEAYDVNGAREWYGPVTLRETRTPFPLHLRTSPLLGQGAPAAPGRQMDVAPDALEARARGVERAKVEPKRAPSGDMATQQWLAARPAVKLFVGQTGWQRIAWAALWAAGLSRMADPANLQLYLEGREMPLRVTAEGLEFYGVAADTLDSGEAVYWLIEGDRPGRRVGLGASFPLLRPTAQSFPAVTTRADKSVYFAALLNGDEDNFFGSVVATTPVAQSLAIPDPDPTSWHPAEVMVELQGVSPGEHAVSVQWNGQPLGVIAYTGRTVGRGVWNVPADQVLDGTNTVTLHAPTAGDVSLVKAVTVAYTRRLRAVANRLTVNVPRDGAGLGRHVLAIEGFTAPARAFDVTDAAAPVELPVRMTGDVATIAAAPGRRVIVTAPAAMLTPRAEANRPSHWYRADNAADVVIVTHEAFLPAAERLAQARRAEGLAVAIVDIADVYDEWSYGVKSAAALRDFLRHAGTAWARPARYALLVGNATFDPRDYLGFGGNFIPTKLIGVGALETAVDDWLGDMDATGLARLMVGRLPVKTPAEAEIVVSKILAYEQAGDADWKRRALVVADNPDEGGDFDAAASDVLARLPHPERATPIRLSALGPGGARAALLAGMNAGAGLVNYIGHGSVQNWAAENILTSGDAALLTNHGQAGLVASMTCLTGFHHDLYATALGKALVLAPGGAVAVWSSSALTPSDGQRWSNLALLEAMSGPNRASRLGDAIRRAKVATGDLGIRQSWTLLGDPTMRLP